MPILHVGQVTPKLLDQIDQLGRPLLNQQRHLQVEMGSLFAQFGDAVLLNQHHGCRQQRSQAGEALQPKEGGLVEGRHAPRRQGQVGGHPPRNK